MTGTETENRLRGALRQLDVLLFWLSQDRGHEVLADDVANVRGELGLIRCKVLGMIEQLEMENV
jgi:hypothetical protein